MPKFEREKGAERATTKFEELGESEKDLLPNNMHFCYIDVPLGNSNDTEEKRGSMELETVGDSS